MSAHAQDTPIDFSKLTKAQQSFAEIMIGLRGHKDARPGLRIILGHLHEVEARLRGATKIKVIFSNVTDEDLESLGVEEKQLDLVDAKIRGLTKSLTKETKAHIQDLESSIKVLSDLVDIEDPSSRRTLLDAILLTLRKITLSQQRDIDILINPTIGQHDGVGVSNPTSGFTLWLSGNADYVVVEKDAAPSVSPSGSRTILPSFIYFMGIFGSIFFVLEPEAWGSQDEDRYQRFCTCVPEAVSQAIAHIMTVNLPEFRFCLSDGQSWVFFILKKSEDNKLTYYKSATRRLNLGNCNWERNDISLPELMLLVREWLSPTATDPFELDEWLVVEMRDISFVVVPCDKRSY